jgi:hypothetical protein
LDGLGNHWNFLEESFAGRERACSVDGQEAATIGSEELQKERSVEGQETVEIAWLEWTNRK